VGVSITSITEVISQEVGCPSKIRWLRAKYERIELIMIIGLEVPDSPGAFSPRVFVISQFMILLALVSWHISLEDAHE
jgi:hypothetical protein